MLAFEQKEILKLLRKLQKKVNEKQMFISKQELLSLISDVPDGKLKDFLLSYANTDGDEKKLKNLFGELITESMDLDDTSPMASLLINQALSSLEV